MHPVSQYELLQLPIVSLDTAEVVGQVDGLVLDMPGLRVAAFVTRMGFYEASVLPLEAAHAVGRDAVMVPDETALRRVREDKRLESLIDADGSLSGSTVLTTEGQAVGVVGAYYLDRDSGRLAGVQLIPPIEIDTAPEGLLPFSAVHRMGDSLLIIDGGYQAMLVQDEEGLAAAMAAPTEAPPASDDVGEAAASAKSAPLVATVSGSEKEEVGAGAGAEADRPKERRPRRSRSRRQTEPVSEPAAAAVPEASGPDEGEPKSSTVEGPSISPTAERPSASDQTDPADTEPTEPTERHFLIGKRVLRRIETPGGTLIADGGETVTPEMVRHARANDQLLILGLNVE